MMRLFVGSLVLFLWTHIAFGSCTPIPITVCTEILYKNGSSKTIECSTTYEWECSDSTGGGSSGSGGSGGSGGTGGSTGGGPTTPINADQITECMKGVVNYTSVLYEFQDPRRQDNHGGIDLAAPNGTLLRSPVNGKVINVVKTVARDHNRQNDPSQFQGNQIIIELEGARENGTLIVGRVTQVILDHLDPNITVSKGDTVSIGQAIGATDNTGNTTIEAHLHMSFQIFTGTTMEDVNPRDFITKENCD